ncbi:MAG: gliding motility-associated C-terminal domain-containing protein [Bacteroidales bacterium]|nr:gliding motility-associated C-terminal domain-containing protein [Bacteroidales bacterium]
MKHRCPILIFLLLPLLAAAQVSCPPLALPWFEDFETGFTQNGGWINTTLDSTYHYDDHCWTHCLLHYPGWRSMTTFEYLSVTPPVVRNNLLHIEKSYWDFNGTEPGELTAVTPPLTAPPVAVRFHAYCIMACVHGPTITDQLHDTVFADGVPVAIGYITDNNDPMGSYIPLDTVYVRSYDFLNKSVVCSDLHGITIPPPRRLIFRVAEPMADWRGNVMIYIDSLTVSNDTLNCDNYHRPTTCDNITLGREFWGMNLWNTGWRGSMQYREVTAIRRNSLTLTIEDVDGLTFTANYAYPSGFDSYISFGIQNVIPSVQTLGVPYDGGFRVLADSDIEVVAHSYDKGNFETSKLLDISALDTHYIIQDYPPSDPCRTQVGFVATEDSTVLTMTLPCETENSAGDPYPAGTTLTTTLMRRQSLLLVSRSTNASYSGMEVRSNGKPFAAFSGAVWTAVPNTATNADRDHLFEQIIPVKYWGREFVVAGASAQQGYNRLRITSSADGCIVAVDGVVIDILARGATCDHTLPAQSQVLITSTQPVLVTLYLDSYSLSGNIGNPASVTIPPVNRGICRSLFLNFHNEQPLQHYLIIVCDTAYDSALLLDSLPLPSSDSVATINHYRVHRIPVSSVLHYGYHSIETSGGEPFVGYVYGVGDHESYAFMLGFNPVPQLDTVTLTDTACQHQAYRRGPFDLPARALSDVGTFLFTAEMSTEEENSLYCLQLTVLPSPHIHLHDTLIPGDTLWVGDSALTQPGTYTLRLTATNGCDSVVTVSLASCLPEACYSLSRPFIDYDHPVVTFTDCTEGATLSQWLFSDGSTYTGSPLRHQFRHQLPDSLNVTLHTCNRLGCCADTTFPLPLQIRSVWFPNTFTPSAESNNRFGAVTSMEVSEYELVVFNRRGQEVFHTTDIRILWDGTFGGTPLPQGSYVYRWNLRDTTDLQQHGTGTVTLLR